VAAGLAVWAFLLARGAARRLVVYHVEPEALTRALEDVLARSGGRFVRTLGGYEDRNAPRGLRVEFTRALGCAVVEAHGRDAGELIREVRPRLQRRLAEVRTPASRVALALFGCSVLVLLSPLVGAVLTQPHACEAIRALLPTRR
jgi:hypothetical protein